MSSGGHSTALSWLWPWTWCWTLASSLQEVSRELEWLSPGGSSGRATRLARTCWRRLHPRLYRVRHLAAEPAHPALLPWSSLYRQTVVPLSPHTPGSLVWEMRAPSFPFLLLPPRPPTVHESAGLGRTFPFCTHVLVSLGASTSFSRAHLSSVSCRWARGRFWPRDWFSRGYSVMPVSCIPVPAWAFLLCDWPGFPRHA